MDLLVANTQLLIFHLKMVVFLLIIDGFTLINAMQSSADLVGSVEDVRFGWASTGAWHHEIVVGIALGFAHLTDDYNYYMDREDANDGLMHQITIPCGLSF